jgi:hypothetical protein
MSKKYPELTEQIRWEDDEVRLVQLYGLATGAGKYKRIPGRRIEAWVVHQAASAPKSGQSAPRGIANFHTANPKYKLDDKGKLMYRTVKGKKKPIWIGGGKGWPGMGYQFCIPTHPDIEDGKIVIYQTHDEDIWSWSTSAAINKYALAVVMSGTFRSEHDPHNPLALDKPEPEALTALDHLTFDYILPRHNLTAEENLFGHFDFGKAACPGDYLEQWVRHHRGENVPDPSVEFLADPDPIAISKATAKLNFPEVKDRQLALIKAGFSLEPWGADGKWGSVSRSALLAFQDSARLEVDGVYGPKTDKALKKAVDALG